MVVEGDHMEKLTLIVLLGTGIALLSLIYIIFYNGFQNHIVKINIVENNIDDTIRKKFDLLNQIARVIEGNIKEEVNLIKNLEGLQDINISNFDLDRKLINITNEIFELKSQQCSLDNVKNLEKLLFQLDENDELLMAYKDYYNDTIAKYNKMVRVFPSNIVSIISRFNEKLFYDGKDMNDEATDDFKL
jgi:LemA protein